MQPELPNDIAETVARALAEDVGDGDRTAALVPAEATARATVVAREAGIIAGSPWFTEVYRQLDERVSIRWHSTDGDALRPEDTVCELSGPARALLTGERTSLNFLQMLSGVATATRRYVERIKGTRAQVLDTRKTLPGLRSAQKYAIRCGGGENHRFGLFDAILIKENHIAVIGSITMAVERARAESPDLPIQVEVEDLTELDEALACDVDAVLLDNFPSHILARAVNMIRRHRRANRQSILIEASGDINLRNVRDVADNEVDRISIGGLTKHVTAIDLSMRLQKA